MTVQPSAGPAATPADRVLALVPAHTRRRDAAAGGLLAALADAVGARTRGARARHRHPLRRRGSSRPAPSGSLPYLADLVGVTDLPPALPGVVSRRAFVANTIAYRRRKGTLAVLEQVARDVTGWPAKVVEYYRLLAASTARQPRPDRPPGRGVAAHRDRGRRRRHRRRPARPAADRGLAVRPARRSRTRRTCGTSPPAGAVTASRTSRVLPRSGCRCSCSGGARRVRRTAPRTGSRPPPARPGPSTRWAGRPRCSRRPRPRTPSSTSRPRPTCRCRCARGGCSPCCRPRAAVAAGRRWTRRAAGGRPGRRAEPRRAADPGRPARGPRTRARSDHPDDPAATVPPAAPGDGRRGHRAAVPVLRRRPAHADGRRGAVRLRAASPTSAPDLRPRRSRTSGLEADPWTGDPRTGRTDVRDAGGGPRGRSEPSPTRRCRGSSSRAAAAEASAIAVGGTLRRGRRRQRPLPGAAGPAGAAVTFPAATRLVVVAAAWRGRSSRPASSRSARLGLYDPQGLRPRLAGTLTVTGAGAGSSVVLDGLVVEGDVVVGPADLGSLT